MNILPSKCQFDLLSVRPISCQRLSCKRRIFILAVFELDFLRTNATKLNVAEGAVCENKFVCDVNIDELAFIKGGVVEVDLADRKCLKDKPRPCPSFLVTYMMKVRSIKIYKLAISETRLNSGGDDRIYVSYCSISRNCWGLSRNSPLVVVNKTPAIIAQIRDMYCQCPNYGRQIRLGLQATNIQYYFKSGGVGSWRAVSEQFHALLKPCGDARLKVQPECPQGNDACKAGYQRGQGAGCVIQDRFLTKPSLGTPIPIGKAMGNGHDQCSQNESCNQINANPITVIDHQPPPFFWSSDMPLVVMEGLFLIGTRAENDRGGAWIKPNPARAPNTASSDRVWVH